MRLLVIEDDVANQNFLERSLTQNGFQVDIAPTGKAAERMGGRAGFESELGKGSKFWIELKQVESDKSSGA